MNARAESAPDVTTDRSPDLRARAGLLALALSAFATGSAEFIAIGLLPELADDLGVGLSTAALVVSVYAATVVVGGPLITAAGTRLPRTALLVGLMAVFTLGNLVAALAPSMPVLLAGRVLAAIGQGAFFGVGSVVAAGLVPPHLRSRAIATVFAGVTIANVLGAPLGTLVGQQLGWRAAMAAVAGLGLLGAVAILLAVPRSAAGATSLSEELAAFRRPQVWLTLAVGTLAMAGIFTMFSYIAPLVTEAAGMAPSALTPVLVAFGLGLTAGTVYGGRLADADPLRTMVAAPALLAVALAGLALTASWPAPMVVMLVLAGVTGYAVIPAYLGRLIALAGCAPTLTAAAAGSAGNLGVAAGAWAGGWALDAGLGWTGPVWVAVVPAVAAALLAAVLLVRDRRRA